MKITIDFNVNDPSLLTCKVGNKVYGKDMETYRENQVDEVLRNFLISNTKLSDYEMDCMWMSYRYCIGRHTIASHMHANEIWKNCKGRMSKERQLFTAFDINREIESSLMFMKPYFHFPLTSLNKIYTPAVDIICQFIEDYNIKSETDFIKYRNIHVILADNERGYKFETVTWGEWLRPQVHKIVSTYYGNNDISEDFAWEYFIKWKEKPATMTQGELVKSFEKITSDMPNPEHYYMHDFEDLFVWNDLVHCFDYEHHHKSILVDGSEVEWFWAWTNNSEKHDDGYYYRSFGYHQIRVPVNEWNGNYTKYIPDSSIKKDLY